MRLPTDILIEEHNLIERMLPVLKQAAARLEKGEPVSGKIFLECVDFIRNFADRCHHQKEENILFNYLEKRGIPRKDGPVACMLSEHEEGRHYVRALEEAALRWQNGNESARNKIIHYVQSYTDLLSQHIYKENHILFPMGNTVLSQADQQLMYREFERVEKEDLGEGVHQKYKILVEALEDYFGHPVNA